MFSSSFLLIAHTAFRLAGTRESFLLGWKWGRLSVWKSPFLSARNFITAPDSAEDLCWHWLYRPFPSCCYTFSLILTEFGGKCLTSACAGRSAAGWRQSSPGVTAASCQHSCSSGWKHPRYDHTAEVMGPAAELRWLRAQIRLHPIRSAHTTEGSGSVLAASHFLCWEHLPEPDLRLQLGMDGLLTTQLSQTNLLTTSQSKHHSQYLLTSKCNNVHCPLSHRWSETQLF